MKSTIIFTSLCATLAMASPMLKRALVTEVDIVTVTEYVTASAAPTSAGQFYASSSPAAATTAAWGTWSSAAPAAASSSAPDYSGLSSYAAPILEQHNLHRANHSSPPLAWDNDLANIAQQIAETCIYAHNTAMGGGNYGQNIGAGAPGSDVPKMITNDMYNGEMSQYPGYGGEPDMSNFENWGHFSQIVWADTTSVGCYTAYCGSGLANTGSGVSPYFTVCNYKPAGNFGGQYGANVHAPLGESTVTM